MIPRLRVIRGLGRKIFPTFQRDRAVYRSQRALSQSVWSSGLEDAESDADIKKSEEDSGLKNGLIKLDSYCND